MCGYGEKESFLHCWWKCKLVLSLCKTLWKFLKKLKTRATTRSNRSTPGYIPKENGNTNSKRYTYQFIAALFIIAKMWIQPKCPTVDEWVKKMWYTHIYMEKAMAPHSSTLAWKIPWTEEPGRLQSMGSHRIGHDWATSLSLSLSCIGEGNGNPLQCSCLENPRDRRAWWAAVYGVSQSQTWLKRLSSSSRLVCLHFGAVWEFSLNTRNAMLCVYSNVILFHPLSHHNHPRGR